MSAPADNGATDIVDIEVGGDDSPRSSASPEVVRLPRWDDLLPEPQPGAQVHPELQL